MALGVLTFWTARATFSAGGSTRSFCRALTFIGAVFAITAVLQKAVSPRSVLFMIEPDARSASPFGAFVNRNHFGGWLLMVAAPVAGYLVARTKIHQFQRRRWRESIGQLMSSGIVFTAIAVIAIVGVLLVTLSRSALAGLGVAALVGWRLGRPRLKIERTSLPGMLGLIGAVLLILVVFVDVDRWATRVGESFDTTSAPLSRIGDLAGVAADRAGLLAHRERRGHVLGRDDRLPAIAGLGRLDAAVGALQQRALALPAGRVRGRIAARPPGAVGAHRAGAARLSRGSLR